METTEIKSYNTEISKDDNIDNILKLFFSIIKIGKDKRIFLLTMDGTIWIEYEGFYSQIKNLDNIYKIKDCIVQANYPVYIINNINNELCSLGIKMKKEKTLKNDGVIKFLINFSKKNSQFHPYNC